MSDAPSAPQAAPAPRSHTASQTAHARARKAAKPSAMIPHQRRGNSKYKPEHCEITELLGKQGKSLMEIATVLNIDRKTLYQWEADYPAFGQALARARTFAQAWWEGKAQKSLGKKQFQAQLWRYSMAGRFKEDYAEQRTTAQDIVDLGAAIADVISRRPRLPGDAAKPVEAQHVVLEDESGRRSNAEKESKR